MPLTIRKHLTRRWWLSFFAFFAFALLTGAVLNFPKPGAGGILTVYRLLLVGELAALIWIQYRTPCPNCGKPIGRLALTITSWKYVKTSPHCPNCDMSVDRDLLAGA
jgi:hypothetical protein